MNNDIIKKMRLLMEYNTSLTKDENLNIVETNFSHTIEEQVDDVVTRVFGGVARGEIDDVLRGMAKKGAPLQTKSGILVKTADDLDDVLKKAKPGQQVFNPQMLGTLRQNLMRSPNISLASKSTAIDDLINGQSFLSKYGNSSYDDIVKNMKKPGNGFPDDVADEIAKRHTSRATPKPQPGPGPKPKPQPKPQPGPGPGPKPKPKPKPKPNPNKPKPKRVRQKYGDKWKSMSRTQKVLALVVAGVGAYYLWQWLRGEDPKLYPNCLMGYLTDEDTEKMKELRFSDGIIIQETGINQLDVMGGLKFFSDGTCTSLDGRIEGEWSSDSKQITVTIGGQSSILPCGGEEVPEKEEDEDKQDSDKSKTKTWRTDCSPNYTIGCKSDKIEEIQKCLGGLVVDGKFGPKTQAALEKKGFPNGFSDSDIPKICGNTPTVTQTPKTDFDDMNTTSQGVSGYED